MYDRRETTQEAAARLGLPEQFTAMHEGRHVCIDGRHYNASCLITDPDCDDIARSRMHLPAADTDVMRGTCALCAVLPGWPHAEGCPNGQLTYDEAIELAAKLSGGVTLARLALAGDLGMTRVPAGDRESTEAMMAEIETERRAMQAITRQGRRPIPVALVLAG